MDIRKKIYFRNILLFHFSFFLLFAQSNWTNFSLNAEILYLNSGMEVQGKIKNQNLYYVEMLKEDGESIFISKEKIRKISYSKIQMNPPKNKIIETTENKTIPEQVPHKDPDPPKKDPEPSLVYEVTKDGRIYLIDVSGENFTGTIKAFLVTEDSKTIIEQSIRNPSNQSFLLCVDSSKLQLGEYDLLVQVNEDEREYKISQFVLVVEPTNTDQNTNK